MVYGGSDMTLKGLWLNIVFMDNEGVLVGFVTNELPDFILVDFIEDDENNVVKKRLFVAKSNIKYMEVLDEHETEMPPVT